LLDEDLHRVGSAGAPEVGMDRDRFPARFVELLPRVLEPARGPDLAAFELAALRVADDVQRPEDLADEAVTLGEGALHLSRTQAVEGRFPEDLSNLELLEEQEAHLAEIGLVAVDLLDRLRHGCSFARLASWSYRTIVRLVARRVKAKLNDHSLRWGLLVVQ